MFGISRRINHGEIMKSTALILVFGAILLAAGAAGAEESRTFIGEFVWNQRGNRGDLEAVFTATGEGTWDVTFRFSFRGSPHLYQGTAEGSLTEGDLSGKVLNESKKRTFTFTGAFKDGEFRGTHAEIEGRRKVDTGTLTLGG